MTQFSDESQLELDLTLQSNRTANRAGLTAQFTLVRPFNMKVTPDHH